MGFHRAAVSTTSREFHPCPFKAALPKACDAFNTRTMAIKAYLPSMRVVARKPLHLLSYAVLLARLFPVGEKCHGAPAVWLGAKKTYPICPMLRRRYLAGFLCQGAGRRFRVSRARKGGGRGGFLSSVKL